MLHRIKKQHDVHAGKWSGLGGKFLPGESPEECVKREVYEESGLCIQAPILRGLMSFPDFKANEDWYVYLYTANQFTGELKVCDEGHLEWIDSSKINELNLWQGDYLFLKWLRSGKYFAAEFIYEQKVLKDHTVTFY